MHDETFAFNLHYGIEYTLIFQSQMSLREAFAE